MVDLEHFVCAMYGHVRYHVVNKLRYDMFVEKCQLESLDANKGADLSLLPLCRQALRMHIKRVNYKVRVWKDSHVQNPKIPSLLKHGWTMVSNKVEPQWVDEDVRPTSLIDIIDKDDVHSDQSDEEDFEGENMQDVVFNEDED